MMMRPTDCLSKARWQKSSQAALPRELPVVTKASVVIGGGAEIWSKSPATSVSAMASRRRFSVQGRMARAASARAALSGQKRTPSRDNARWAIRAKSRKTKNGGMAAKRKVSGRPTKAMAETIAMVAPMGLRQNSAASPRTTSHTSMERDRRRRGTWLFSRLTPMRPKHGRTGLSRGKSLRWILRQARAAPSGRSLRVTDGPS